MRAIVFALTLFFATIAHAIPIADYVATLERAHQQLAANQLDAAKAEAARIKGAQVEWSGGRFHADDTLIAQIGNVQRADRQVMNRIAHTVNELRRSGAVEGASTNPKLLEQVTAEQDVEALERGGELQIAAEGERPNLERIAASIGRMFVWLGEKIAKLFRWILDLFPRRGEEGSRGGLGTYRTFIGIAILIGIALAILAFNVIRQSKRGASEGVVTSVPLGSKRDEDPLSRGATEWERYAAQLASAGRFREAIRAMYHAVLVTCYAAGVLHFRKGRTNWEYIATLAPSLAWRAELIALTRRFEREWYGHDQSTDEAFEECSDRAKRILDAVRRRGAA